MVERKDIELICQLSEDWNPGNIEVKRIGGETNRNYKVRYKNVTKLVRLPWEGSEIVDREIEAQNIIALLEDKELAKFLPYHIYILKGQNVLSKAPKRVFNLPDGTMVMGYISGEDLNAKLLEKKQVQEVLVNTLHLFHTSGVRFVNSYNPFKDEIEKYKNQVRGKPITELVGAEELEEVAKVEKIMEEKLPLEAGISTHNDLIFGNLRLGKDERVYLLDFEYAGFNVRGGLYYDFGTLLGENLFGKEPLKIKTYQEILQRASQVYGREFQILKAYYGAMVNVLVTFWWGLDKYFSSKTEKDRKYFSEYVPKRIQGIRFLHEIIEKGE